MIKKISLYVVILAIGAGLGSYFNPIHTIEEKIVVKDRIKTVIKEVVTQRPDGTIVTEREIHKDEKKDSVATRKESIPTSKNWSASVKYDLFRPVPVWTIEVQRRVLGNIYAGAYGRTDGIVGVGVTLLF